jgi:hypothetical protein
MRQKIQEVLDLWCWATFTAGNFHVTRFGCDERRVEGPRVTVALLALGRVRDAWARAGGAVALLAAVPVVMLNRATLNLFMENEVGLFVLAVALLVLARYGEVIVALPSKGRQLG